MSSCRPPSLPPLRSGTVLKGVWETHNGERWAKFDNGFYLPEKQKGFTILFEVK